MYLNYQKIRNKKLTDFYNRSFNKSEEINDVLTFHKEVKKQLIEKDLFFVTNLNNRMVEYFGTHFYSMYQRQGHQVRDKELISMLYGSDLKVIHDDTFFVNSCQAGHRAIFKILHDKYNFNKIIHGKTKIYFETLKVWNSLNSKNNLAEKSFYFLDSSTNDSDEYLKDISANNIDLIIFDTTCFSRSSEKIKKILTFASEKRLPILLSRSHLKLDSFGVEYGQLGSLCFIDFAKYNQQEIVDECYKELSMSGNFGPLINIYPFLFDQELKDLSDVRVQLIRKNCKALHKELGVFCKENDLILKVFEHELFFNIIFKDKKDDKDFIKMGELFLKFCNLHQIPARFCDSFGFDFPSLTSVNSYEEKTNLSYLRFCPGALDMDVNLYKKILIQIIEKNILN